jgi:hypothetical protein
MYELDDVLDILGDLEHRIRAAGEIAQPETVIEVVPHSKTGKRYARKRTTIKGKNTFEGCGQEGSLKHLNAVATVQRRVLLEQLNALTTQIENWKTADDWQALTSPQTTTAAVEVMDIDEMIEAEELPLLSRPLPAESDIMSFAFKGNKGATPENRLVHAVPGEPPMAGFGYWDTPALCGAKPDWMKNWGWIGDCTIMYLSCRKCEKKLKTTPHSIKLPKGFGGSISRGLVIE